jgi:hypothetical protein
MHNIEDKFVYESPDGGDTVYRRRPHSAERELIKQGPLHQKLLRSQLWREIFQCAESDKTLRDMIDQVEVYHRLKHKTRP